MIDHAAAAKAIGAGTSEQRADWSPEELPEPLASVVKYLGDDLDGREREFVPTAELTEVLSVDKTVFGQQMGALGCQPTRYRVPLEDGGTHRVRGYLVADIRDAVERASSGEISASDDAGNS